MKKVLAGLVLVAIIAATFFGYQHYAAAEFAKSLHSPVKEVSLRMKSLFDDTVQPGQITFREYAEKADSTVKSAEEAVFKIESMDAKANPQAAEAAIDYIKQARDFARGLRAMNAAEMKSNSAVDRFRDAVHQIGKATSSQYAAEYAKEQAEKASTDAKEAVARLEETNKNGRAIMAKFIEASEAAGHHFSPDMLVPKEAIDKIQTYLAEDEKKEEKKS